MTTPRPEPAPPATRQSFADRMRVITERHAAPTQPGNPVPADEATDAETEYEDPPAATQRPTRYRR